MQQFDPRLQNYHEENVYNQRNTYEEKTQGHYHQQQQYQAPNPHQQHQKHNHNVHHHYQQMQRQIIMEDGIRIARERVPGQAVKAELERKNGRLIYEVDIITSQGIKYEVMIDANSGTVLGVELDQ